MATYKKRGYKLPKEKEAQLTPEELLQQEQDELAQESTTAEVFEGLDQTANKAEQWIADKQKPIMGVISLVLLGVLGYMAYQQFVVVPNNKEAVTKIYASQKVFNEAVDASLSKKDSLYKLSLNGDQQNIGFKAVVEDYGSTQTGNLAKYYAGIASLRTGAYTEAIGYLEDFDGNNTVLSSIALGAIGDAFVQLNQHQDAIKYYEKAANINPNDLTTPKFLEKAARVALHDSLISKAITYLERIDTEFKGTKVVNKLDQLLAKARAMSN